MLEPPAEGEPRKRRKKKKERHFLLRHLPFEHETALYLLFSIGDIVMTYILLRTGGFYEANPIARFFIAGWGPRGMVYFKFSVVAFVCVLTQIIATRRPATAQRILQLATVIVAGVVVYSIFLFVRHTGAA